MSTTLVVILGIYFLIIAPILKIIAFKIQWDASDKLRVPGRDYTLEQLNDMVKNNIRDRR